VACAGGEVKMAQTRKSVSISSALFVNAITPALPHVSRTDAVGNEKSEVGGQSQIFFCGDVHGHFDHVIEAVRQHGPAAIVLLGDVQAQKPLEQELAPILEKTAVWFIHGNHDTDSDAAPQTTVHSPQSKHRAFSCRTHLLKPTNPQHLLHFFDAVYN
jgi:Calcineurin-like phosphoesterase